MSYSKYFEEGVEPKLTENKPLVLYCWGSVGSLECIITKHGIEDAWSKIDDRFTKQYYTIDDCQLEIELTQDKTLEAYWISDRD